jgi:serine/threonine-protein kinase
MARCIQCPEGLDAGVRVCPRCKALQPITVQRGPVGPGATVELGYGRIVVQARLGEGGMGAVYRAWLFHAPDGPRGAEPPLPLALKVLHARAADTPEVRALFADEAEALKSLRHPNIVRFHDFFDWGGPLALAMELVEGNNLEEVIARNRARARLAGRGGTQAIATARAWYYFQQLLGALAATHALGIVHRDVKPSNVLIRGDGIVKLGDFGIARLVRDRAVEPAAPPAHALGTGAYMSPEQVLAGPVDARSDLYSAAIVFYEMLAGRPPFSPDERSEFFLRQDQIESAPPPLGVVAPDAPEALEPLMAKALAKDPSYRFASALDLGDAIREALGERETTAWGAQREIARNAPLPTGARERDARAARLTTLHDEVIAGYQSTRGHPTGR